MLLMNTPQHSERSPFTYSSDPTCKHWHVCPTSHKFLLELSDDLAAELTIWFMVLRWMVASSSVWPPDRNMMPGMAAGTVLGMLSTMMDRWVMTHNL